MNGQRERERKSRRKRRIYLLVLYVVSFVLAAWILTLTMRADAAFRDNGPLIGVPQAFGTLLLCDEVRQVSAVLVALNHGTNEDQMAITNINATAGKNVYAWMQMIVVVVNKSHGVFNVVRHPPEPSYDVTIVEVMLPQHGNVVQYTYIQSAVSEVGQEL